MYNTIPWIVGYSKTLEPIQMSKNRGLVKGTMAHSCSEYNVEVKKKKKEERSFLYINMERPYILFSDKIQGTI